MFDLHTTVSMDFETRSRIQISNGAHCYAEDSAPIVCTYALGDEPVKAWEPHLQRDIPVDLAEYLQDPKYTLMFHNVEFDRTNMVAWEWDGLYGADLNPRRFLCSMTWARMCRLPGGLDELCQALGVPEAYAKKNGKALIRLFCVPTGDGSFVSPLAKPKDWADFVTYAKHDIEAMRECAKRMPDVFNYIERELYARTVEMNDRGVGVDRELATKAMLQADTLKKRYKKEGGQLAAKAEMDRFGSQEEVEAASELSITSQKAMLEFLSTYGVKLDDARAATIERFLDTQQADLLPAEVRALMSTRLKANKASVAKYKSVLQGCNADGRIRGLITPYGAGTGRDAGRRFQVQNLARPVYIGEKHKTLTMEEAAHIVKQGTAELYFDDPMQLLSDTVRGVLIPTQGKKFCGADLSSIEGRVLPWLAREEWMVQYFRDLDAGVVKYDGYQLAYATAFGVDPTTVTKAQRTLGKPIDLASGFGGGTGALITFATLYRIDIDDMAMKARELADPYLWAECAGKYEWYKEKGLTNNLSEFTWIGCQYIIDAWRNKRSLTKALWKQCETAFENAILNPGISFEMANNTFAFNSGGWVFVTLPSGRNLVYPAAHIADRGGRKQLAYMGVNPFTRKWGQIYTYGGKLCIAEGTLVLTKQDGWTTIENITSEHEVWDGLEWVRSDGNVCNGDKEVIRAHGAWMTPDHEVLTEEGWMCASQSQRYNRAESRLPDGAPVPQQRWEEVSVGGRLRLRDSEANGCERAKEAGHEGHHSVLRMSEESLYQQAKHDAWNVKPPCLCGVAQHDRSLPITFPSSMGKLWRAGHNSLQTVAAILRELLGGHGANLRSEANARPQGQQQGVLAGELSLGVTQSTGEQHSIKPHGGERDRLATSGTSWRETEHDVLPTGGWSPIGETGRSARLHSKVYDLVNCGPRNRFVVWADGAPLIVHNCENLTQAVARDVLFWSIPAVENAGYSIVTRIHDELLTEAPDTDAYSGDTLARLISTPHSWCADLPLNAAGETNYRFQK